MAKVWKRVLTKEQDFPSGSDYSKTSFYGEIGGTEGVLLLNTSALAASPTASGTYSTGLNAALGLVGWTSDDNFDWRAGVEKKTGFPGISVLGRIGAGTWSATTIPATKGGTGLTSAGVGTLLYASATNTLAALAHVPNQILKSNGSLPSWGSLSLSTAAEWGGTIPVFTTARGGTGVNLSTGTAGHFLISSGSAFEWVSISTFLTRMETSASTHNHDTLYVKKAGMTGILKLAGTTDMGGGIISNFSLARPARAASGQTRTQNLPAPSSCSYGQMAVVAPSTGIAGSEELYIVLEA